MSEKHKVKCVGQDTNEKSDAGEYTAPNLEKLMEQGMGSARHLLEGHGYDPDAIAADADDVINQWRQYKNGGYDMFSNMVDILPEGELGVAKVKHIKVSEEAARFSSLRAAVTGGRDAAVREGVYAQLFVGQTLMMSDTQMERSSNYDVLWKSGGDVLIAGLGIGLIVEPILKKEDVRSVTVIEKYKDVIDLVGPPLEKLPGGEKLNLVHEDILTWKPPKGQKWDCIYFDIWPDICTDNLKEISMLHRRFARRKNPGGWMDSWQREYLKSLRRRGY